MQPSLITARLRPHVPAAVPGLGAVALMLLWAIHDGGYDAETWYWGALAVLGLLAGTVVALGDRIRVSREQAVILGLFALYVAWCYLSITWSRSPGDALAGGNQALLYLLVFSLMLLLPWTVPAALTVLTAFVFGIGVVGIVLLFRLAGADHVAGLIVEGRLGAPTGYFNSTAALFTINALAATMLASRRELPGPLRGLMLAFACCGLQLGVIVQSRGWLFTLPIVLVVALIVVPQRLRVAVAAIFPLVGIAVPLQRLLNVYTSSGAGGLAHASEQAGQAALLLCAGIFIVGTLAAWADSLWRGPGLSHRVQRWLGATVAAIAAIAVIGAGTYATHGHPFRFISRQWNGFSHVQRSFSSSSHFGDVGSGRYDFWRVSLDALLAHPIGGLGEDNFANYYLTHRHTAQEPSWPHSIELRLLAQTGIVGFVLFTAFMVAALRPAVRARRRGSSVARATAATALLPLVVWLIHGSLDWFWEMPALSAPALGFLAMAAGLSTRPAGETARPRVAPRRLRVLTGVLALVAGVIVLGFPYLSVRETSLASNEQGTDPAAALRLLSSAADLNPLSALPARLAGSVALQHGEYAVAVQRFSVATAREPQGWFAWLGAGLAESGRGHRAAAHRDFVIANSIDSRQPSVSEALKRVYTSNPLTSAEAFKLFIIQH